MEIEKLFVSMAVDAAEYLGGLADATKGGLSWAADWGKKVSAALSAAFMIGVTLVIAGLATIGAAAFTVASDIQNATVDIQSQLGATGEEAERLGNIAADVWGNNFAGSIGEAADALVQVRQQLGDLSDQELQNATENAFRLADTFDTDVNENIHAAGVLMDTFGLSQAEAFDFITKGFQSGLNASDDFLDSIGEYSGLFSETGFDADEMFSIMETGMQGGVLGTDKVADAIKEMGIILSEGTDDARAALTGMGLDFDQIAASVAAGDETWADYFPNIVDGLNDIEDPMARQQAQVALFGTMAEDLGASFTEGLSTASTALDDMTGSTAALDIRYNTLGDVVEGFKRRAILALEPIGAVLLDLANRIMPHINTAFAFFETNVVPAIEMVAGVVENFFTNIEAGWTPIMALKTAIYELFSPEIAGQITAVIDVVQNLVRAFQNLFTEQSFFEDDPAWLVSLKEAGDFIRPFIQDIIDMVTQFVSWKDILIVLAGAILATVIPAIVAMIVSMAPIILAIIAIVAIVAFLRNAWESDWGGIQGKVAAVIAFISNLITTVMTFIRDFWAANGDAILAKATAIWQAIWTFIQTAITTIQTIIVTVATAVQEFWAEHGEAILATAQEIWNLIWEHISGVWDIITSLFAAFKSAFEGDWTAFGENLRLAWDAAWQTILNLVANLWDLMKPLLENLWNNLKAWWSGIDWAGLGSDLVDGIMAGIGNLADRLMGALQDAAQAAQDAWDGFWGNESPSKWMIDSMQNVTAGAVIGLDGSQLVAQAQSIAARVAAPFAAIEPVSIGDRIGGMGSLSMAGAGGQETSYSYTYQNYGSQPKDPASWFKMRQKLDEVKV